MYIFVPKIIFDAIAKILIKFKNEIGFNTIIFEPLTIFGVLLGRGKELLCVMKNLHPIYTRENILKI